MLVGLLGRDPKTGRSASHPPPHALPSSRIPHSHMPLLSHFHHIQTIGATTADMDTNTMADEFRTFLEGCDEAMASQIIGVLQQAGRHIVPSTASGMTARRSAVAKTEKKQRKKTKSDPSALGPKRPLNSWMAFRSKSRASMILTSTDAPQSSTMQCSEGTLRRRSPRP